MKLTVIGCGDAFNSGGRFHSCYLLDTSHGRFMLDCGANSPLALKRAGVSLDTVDAVVVSHCHGDHFGGVPFLVLERMFVQRGPKPLEIIGPKGIERRTMDLMEALYPTIASAPRAFEIQFREIEPGSPLPRGVEISAFEVEHFSGAPSLALSIADSGKRFSFSGDSSWCDGVIEAGRDADLFLVECSTFAPRSAMHLDYVTLATKFAAIGAKRYLLTHMGPDMLAAPKEIDRALCLLAEDGMMVNF
jgi:ribonuclease BN (tRNA processing enzyme)